MSFFHFGYIDPGTGSILIQGLIGGFFGAAYMGRKFISQTVNNIKSAFSTQRSGQDSGEGLEASDKL